jgi:hypothetical protein
MEYMKTQLQLMGKSNNPKFTGVVSGALLQYFLSVHILVIVSISLVLLLIFVSNCSPNRTEVHNPNNWISLALQRPWGNSPLLGTESWHPVRCEQLVQRPASGQGRKARYAAELLGGSRCRDFGSNSSSHANGNCQDQAHRA